MNPVLYLGCPSSDRADTERLLATSDLSVVWADTVDHALNELGGCDMPVIFDLSADASALQRARDLRAHRQATLMFAVVDPGCSDLTTEAVLVGVADVFSRPLGGRQVAGAIARELAPVKGDTLAETGGALLYDQSPGMREVTAQISRASAIRAGVMIRGEEGTGRHVAARAIHEAPVPVKGAFVCIDCAADDADRLEAALFGGTPRLQHDEGSAPGLERLSRHSRLFEARNGTLYLKNIAEASTRVQARLARVLRDREAVLIESGEAVVLDVRPVAAADVAFDSAVQEGRVREDLFRRLSAIRIEMPPLRSRREDIPALVNFLLRDICRALRLPPKTLSRPALSLITALPWRGNADELRALLEAIVAGLQKSSGIVLEDVLAHVRLDGGAVVKSNNGTLRQARAQFEREYIASVLEHHHGRISEAASVLGIQRTNLYRKMRALRVGPRSPE